MPAAVPAEQRAEAVELLRTVGSTEAVRRSGFSQPSIDRWARDAGVVARRHGGDHAELEACSDADAAYAAGLLDGEGTVAIFCTQRNRNSRGGDSAGSWVLEVAVFNTDRRMLDWLKARFGGSVGRNNRGQTEANNYRPAWRWRAHAAHAEAVLRRIRPWLITKGEQADIAFEFRATFLRGNVHRRPTPEAIAERARLRDALREARVPPVYEDDSA